MLPLRSERLRIDMLRDRHLDTFVTYRNHPEVAHYQDWGLPFTPDDGQRLLDAQRHLEGPIADEWVQLAVEHGDEMVGDFAVGLTHAGSIATIGYTLAPEHQGRGFASEAVAAVVDALIEQGTHRFVASLDPDNVPSMRVVEAVGFTMECLSHRAELVRGQWADDLRYTLLAEERQAWRDRSRTPPTAVRLVEITPDDARRWTELQTHYSQRRMVAPVSMSFSDALFPEVVDGAPVVPWMRGIEADGQRAGFVMLADVTQHHPVPYLWRLLIDRWHQRRGIGERVIGLVADRLRAEECDELSVSWVDGPGGPRPFYERLGFVPTGEVHDGEVVARLRL